MAKVYKLSAVLYGHSLDVRSVDVTNENCVISGSRDKTAKLWKSNAFNSCYADVMTYRAHTNFVSSVCALPPSADYPDGLIITGGNDNQICIFKPGEPFVTFTIKEHTNTVCGLARGIETGTFLSSSWDCTAKLWSIAKPTGSLASFVGHQAAIWAVIQLPNGNVVTGSADKDIIIWEKNGVQVKVVKGHTDCVRGLAILVHENCMVSVANDAAIKMWSYSGELITTLYGHSNYIYSVCPNLAEGNNSFVTSGEDRTIRFWQDGENKDTISVPAQSVWSVACLSNGDIVSGSSDGIVRIFTQDESRFADAEMLKKYEEEVLALDVANNQEIGGVKISDLPGREVLYEPGKKDGQVKMVREGAGVVVYNWSAEAGEWMKIGDVMGGAGGTQASSGKTLYEGIEYDFVFSVDVEDGKPAIKLPYNTSDDPWSAAQKFIDKNDLPQSYLEQVANFIVTNSASARPPTVVPEQSSYVDPFTGGSRYMPGSNAVNTATAGVNLDPFTGGHSYSTQTIKAASYQVPPASAPSGANLDSSTCVSNYFPLINYHTFEMGSTQAILSKIKEFNQKSGDGNSSIDENLLDGLMKVCSGSSIDGVYIDILVTLLNWPDDIVFPVLDVIRLAVRHPENNVIFASESIGIFLMEKLNNFVCSDCTVQNNTLLSLRILANLFAHSAGEQLVYENRDGLLENITSLGKYRTKQIQIALATFLSNLCISSIKRQDENGIILMGIVVPDVILNINEPEAEFRSYVALGTILVKIGGPLRQDLKNKVKMNAEFLEKLTATSRTVSNNEAESKNCKCAEQIYNLIMTN